MQEVLTLKMKKKSTFFIGFFNIVWKTLLNRQQILRNLKMLRKMNFQKSVFNSFNFRIVDKFSEKSLSGSGKL